jgi:hypothetical protein
MVASGLFSSCATPEIGLAERGQLLGLQQLLVEVARLVVELLALADVAQQRLDAENASRQRLGARGELDPELLVVGPAHPEQVVGHRALAGEAIDERLACLRVGET